MAFTLHQVEEFVDCPLLRLTSDDLESDKWKQRWSLGSGGYGLPDWQKTLSIVDESLHSDVWPLPPIVAEAIELAKTCAVNGRITKIKAALGI